VFFVCLFLTRKCYYTLNMNVWLAVIDDLWKFVYTSLFGVIKNTDTDKIPKTLALQNTLANNQEQGLLFSGDEIRLKPTSISNFVNGEKYFIGSTEVYLYSDPVITFDSVICPLSYGQTVILEKLGGRWAEVKTDDYNGWVLKDVLVRNQSDIQPQFVNGNDYTAHNVETIKLRALIADEFSGARAGLSLTSAEYVFYRLLQNNKFIKWQQNSSRIPGTWQQKLRGQSNIHISISPQPLAVMEYIVDDIGQLAFIESVFDDYRITISEVGWPKEGIYRKTILTQNEYRELQSIFIMVD